MPLVTNAGKAIITGRMVGASPTQVEPRWVSMGTGAVAEAATDTALGTAVESRTDTVAGTRVTTTVTNDTVQWVGTITATAARAVTEAGMFDAATVGNMLMRATFAVINLVTGDSIQFTIKVVFA